MTGSSVNQRFIELHSFCTFPPCAFSTFCMSCVSIFSASDSHELANSFAGFVGGCVCNCFSECRVCQFCVFETCAYSFVLSWAILVASFVCPVMNRCGDVFCSSETVNPEDSLDVISGSKDGKLDGDQAEGSSGVPITSAKKTAVGGGQAKESLNSQGAANAEGALRELPLTCMFIASIMSAN